MEKEFDERVRELASKEIDGKEWNCYYLSWATEDAWLGGAYVLAYGPITARLRCASFGIIPGGGQCLIARHPDNEPIPSEKYRNRLLTREEILEVDPDSKTLGEWERGKQ